MSRSFYKPVIVMLALALLLTAVLGGCSPRSSFQPAAPANTAGPAVTPAPDPAPEADPAPAGLTDEQALDAVRTYCFLANPDLAGIVAAGEYPVDWAVESSDGSGVVVLFRSYTGAQIRYHVDRQTLEASVTEYVPGVTESETPTGETVRLDDYLPAIEGLWMTASMIPDENDSVAPEYFVRFTNAYVIYGHMPYDSFLPERADPVSSFEEVPAGGYKIKASAANGLKYCYLTSAGDPAVMEYYETWSEEAFDDNYRGGASLSRFN